MRNRHGRKDEPWAVTNLVSGYSGLCGPCVFARGHLWSPHDVHRAFRILLHQAISRQARWDRQGNRYGRKDEPCAVTFFVFACGLCGPCVFKRGRLLGRPMMCMPISCIAASGNLSPSSLRRKGNRHSRKDEACAVTFFVFACGLCVPASLREATSGRPMMCIAHFVYCCIRQSLAKLAGIAKEIGTAQKTKRVRSRFSSSHADFASFAEPLAIRTGRAARVA